MIHYLALTLFSLIFGLQASAQPAPGPSCVTVACELLGPTGCLSARDVQEVAKACAHNWGGGCLKTSCKRLGVFGCKDLLSLSQVAQSCQNVYDLNCAAEICAKLGPFGCDELHEVTRINRGCSQNASFIGDETL